MSWPPRQPSRDEISIDELPAYAEVITRARRQIDDPERTGAGFFGRLLLAPRMTAHQSGMGSAVRTSSDTGGYTHADREWIDHVVAVRYKSNVLLGLHVPDAIASGVRPAAIAALRAGREEELTAEERQLTDFIDRILDGKMTKQAWEQLEDRMGERGVVEYAFAVIYISGGTRLQQAVGMPDPPDAEIDKLLDEYLQGIRDAPSDWQTRIG